MFQTVIFKNDLKIHPYDDQLWKLINHLEFFSILEILNYKEYVWKLSNSWFHIIRFAIPEIFSGSDGERERAKGWQMGASEWREKRGRAHAWCGENHSGNGLKVSGSGKHGGRLEAGLSLGCRKDGKEGRKWGGWTKLERSSDLCIPPSTCLVRKDRSIEVERRGERRIERKKNRGSCRWTVLRCSRKGPCRERKRREGK